MLISVANSATCTIVFLPGLLLQLIVDDNDQCLKGPLFKSFFLSHFFLFYVSGSCMLIWNLIHTFDVVLHVFYSRFHLSFS